MINLVIIIKIEEMKTICLLLTPRKGWSNQDEKSNAANLNNNLEKFIAAVDSIADFNKKAKSMSDKDFTKNVLKYGKSVNIEDILEFLYGESELLDNISTELLIKTETVIKEYIGISKHMDEILYDAIDKEINKISNYKDDRLLYDNKVNVIKKQLSCIPTEVLEAPDT